MSDNPSKMSFEQACLYVGLFMHHFSLLESSLNNGVGALLGINGPEQAIATACAALAAARTAAARLFAELDGAQTAISRIHYIGPLV